MWRPFCDICGKEVDEENEYLYGGDTDPLEVETKVGAVNVGFKIVFDYPDHVCSECLLKSVRKVNKTLI